MIILPSGTGQLDLNQIKPAEKWPVKTIIMVFPFCPNVNYKLLEIKYGWTLRHFFFKLMRRSMIILPSGTGQLDLNLT